MSQAQRQPVSLAKIFQIWLPLAASWLIMTAELPVLASMVARKADPQVNLAAWGLIFPFALIMASPVMMLMAASTALSKDWDSYVRLRRYMFVLAGTLTGVHLLLAFTPFFDLLVLNVIGAPADVLEPARLAIRIMLPWTAALAYRRFHYGVLIRCGHPGAVTVGALVRLGVDVVALTLFFGILDLPGAAVAAATIISGVIGEAIYAKIRVGPVLRTELRPAPPVAVPVTLASFAGFYVPLVITSLLQIVVQPIGAMALARMPDPLASLAVWPVVYALLIVFLSGGLAYTEVVVVLLDEPLALANMQRFALLLAGILSGILVIMAMTPLATFWFAHVAALPPDLVMPARRTLWIIALVPAFGVFESWFNGILMNRKRTRCITQAVGLGLTVLGAILVTGIVLGTVPGLEVVAMATAAASLTRVVWLFLRTRPDVRAFRAADLRLAV